MGLVRRAAFVVATAAGCAALVSASVASCTFGTYDGSFDSAALEISTATSTGDGGPSGPPSSGTVDPGAKTTTSVKSSDGVFEVDVPPAAYATPVTITITPLGEHAIDNGFLVPSYQVSVSGDPVATLPVQVVFRGAQANSNAKDALAPVVVSGGTTKLLPIVGGAGNAGVSVDGQPLEVLWGLTKELSATYSLVFAANIAGGNPSTLTDPSSANCIYKCCGVNKPGSGSGGTGNAQLYGTDIGCACANANTALDCFASECSDVDAVAQRCLDLRIDDKLDGGGPECVGAMGPGSTNCSLGNECCYQPGGGNGGFSCGSGGGGFNCTYVERCTSDAQCAAGVCCAYDDEAICSTACPPGRHVCPQAVDAGSPACDGGACIVGGKCRIRTCGATPALCQ